MRSHTQWNEEAQQNNPVNDARYTLLYFLSPFRHAGMDNLKTYNDNIAPEKRSQHSELSRDSEGQEYDWGCIVRAMHREDDECRDGENEREASCGDCRIEVCCEGTGGGCGYEAGEESCFFVVWVGMVVCEEGGSWRCHGETMCDRCGILRNILCCNLLRIQEVACDRHLGALRCNQLHVKCVG